jgi:hypothetical protein
MNKLLALTLVVLTTTKIFGQEVTIGQKYEAQTDFTANEYLDNACITTKKYGICDGTKFEAIGLLPGDNQKVIIKIRKGYTCRIVLVPGDTLDFAIEGKTYCIAKSNFINNLKKPSVQLNTGPLVVPFKFQLKDFKIYSAGEIGYYIGPKFLSKKSPDTYFSIIASAGYSKVPLNDVNASNSEDTRSVDAGSLAGGFVYNFGKDFQIGLLGGADFFNADNQAKSRTWVSFTIGVNLIGLGKKSENSQVRMLTE